MTERMQVERRHILAVAGGTVSMALAGCFGGGGDDDDSTDNGATDETDDDSGESEPDFAVPIEDAEAVIEEFFVAMDESAYDRYNGLLHSSGQEPTIDSSVSRLERTEREVTMLAMSSYEVTEISVADGADDELILDVDAFYEVSESERELVWRVELRVEDGAWRIWNVDEVDHGTPDPAVGPGVRIEEFVSALADGDADAAKELLHSEASENLHDLVDGALGADGGDISLANVTEQHREDGRADFDVVLRVDDEAEEELFFVLRVEDGDWKIRRV